MHKLHPLRFRHGNKVYKGGVDAALVPFGVNVGSAHQLMRIGWEHKQSGKAKLCYQLHHPEAAHVRPDFTRLTIHEYIHTASAL